MQLAQEALPLWRVSSGKPARSSSRPAAPSTSVATSSARRRCSPAAAFARGPGCGGRAGALGLVVATGRALHQPDGGVVWAERALAAFGSSARSYGAHLAEGRKALSLDVRGDGVRVETAEGAVHAHAAVVTAGSWAARLLATAGVNLPLTVTRETVVYSTGPRPTPAVIDWRSTAQPGGASPRRARPVRARRRGRHAEGRAASRRAGGRSGTARRSGPRRR